MATLDFKGDDLYNQFSIADNFEDIPPFVAKTREVKPFTAFMAGAYSGYKNSFINTMFETVSRETSNYIERARNGDTYTPEAAKEIFNMTFDKPVSAKWLHGFLDTQEGIKNAELLKAQYRAKGGSAITPFLGHFAGMTVDALPFLFVGLPAMFGVRSAIGPTLRKIGLSKSVSTDLAYAGALTEGFLSAGMAEALERRDVMLGVSNKVLEANVIGAGVVGATFGALPGILHGRFARNKGLVEKAFKEALDESPQMKMNFDEVLKQETDIERSIYKEMQQHFHKDRLKDKKFQKALEKSADKAFKEMEKNLPDFLANEKGYIAWNTKKRGLSIEEFEKLKNRIEMKKAFKEAFKRTGKIQADDMSDIQRYFIGHPFGPRKSKVEEVKNAMDVIDPLSVVQLQSVLEYTSRQRYHLMKERVRQTYIIEPRYELLKKRLKNMQSVREREQLIAEYLATRKLTYQGFGRTDRIHTHMDPGFDFSANLKKKREFEDDNAFAYLFPFVVGAGLMMDNTIKDVTGAVQNTVDTFKIVGDFMGKVFKKIGALSADLASKQEEFEDDLGVENPKVRGATMHLFPLLFSNLSIQTIANLMVRGLKIGESENDFIPLEDDFLNSYWTPNILSFVENVAEQNPDVDERMRKTNEVNTLVEEAIKPEKNMSEIQKSFIRLFKEAGDFPLRITEMNEEETRFFNRPEIQKLKQAYEDFLGKKFVLRSKDGVNEFLADLEYMRYAVNEDMLTSIMLSGGYIDKVFEYNQDMIFDYPFEAFEKKLKEAQEEGVEIIDMTQKEREERFGMSIDVLSDHIIRSEVDDSHSGIDSYLEISLKHTDTFHNLVKDLEDTVSKHGPSNIEDVINILKGWMTKPDVGIVDHFITEDADRDEKLADMYKQILSADNVFFDEALDEELPGIDLKKGVEKTNLFNTHGFLVSSKLSTFLTGLSFGNFRMMNFGYKHTKEGPFSESDKNILEGVKAFKKLADEDVDAINISSSYGLMSRGTQAKAIYDSVLDKGIVVFQSAGNNPQDITRQGRVPAKHDNYLAIYGLLPETHTAEHEKYKKKPQDLFKRFDLGATGLHSKVIAVQINPKKEFEIKLKRDLGTSFSSPAVMASYLQYLRGAVTGEVRIGPYLTRLFHNYGVAGELPKEYKKEVRMMALWDWIYQTKLDKHLEYDLYSSSGIKVHRVKVPE